MKAFSKLLCLAAAGIVGGIVLAGCGGSGPVFDPPHTTTNMAFHSATGHYSVLQVEKAFEAQGVRLRNVSPKDYKGLLALLDGRPTHQVYVYVEVGKFSGALKPAIRNASVRHHGNVEVLWRGSERSAVRAALRELN